MVNNSPKTRGRPRQFDEREALDGAMRVFWTKGYDGTTIDDLVEATRVGRPSLYATFGDKEALFARCLQHYTETISSRIVEAFLSAKNAPGAVHAFLRQAVVNATGKDTPRGCLLHCVAPATGDEKIRMFLATAFKEAAAMIDKRLRHAVERGDLPRDFPVAARARAVLDASTSLTLRARLGATREELLKDAEGWATLLVPG